MVIALLLYYASNVRIENQSLKNTKSVPSKSYSKVKNDLVVEEWTFSYIEEMEFFDRSSCLFFHILFVKF